MNKFLKYIKENNDDDKSNIFPDPISDDEFRDEIVKTCLAKIFILSNQYHKVKQMQ